VASRVVEWIIKANFGQVRGESRKTEESLRKLDRQKDKFNRDAVAGNAELEKSEKRVQSTIQTSVATHSKAAKEKRAHATETEKLTKATARHAQAQEKEGTAVQRTIASLAAKRQEMSRAIAESYRAEAGNKRQKMSAEQLARAETKVRDAAVARERAEVSLGAARLRLGQVEAKSGRDSAQYASVLNLVKRREIEVTRTIHRHKDAQDRLNRSNRSLHGSTRSAASSIGSFIGAITTIRPMAQSRVLNIRQPLR
jgi:chromosome segregation ATPase